MAHAVISPKFQVVIPKAICREAGLQSGQVVQIISKEASSRWFRTSRSADCAGT